MRVVHVVAGLAARTGGVASALVQLGLGLEEAGVESTILSTDLAETAAAQQRTNAPELPDGAERLDVRLLPARYPKRLAFSPALARAVRDEAAQADVIHIHGLWLHPTFAAWRAAVETTTPYVVCPQGMLDPRLTAGRLRKRATTIAWQRRMLDGAAAVHFTAAAELRAAGAAAGRAPRVVVPNPIDWASYQQQADPLAFRVRHLQGHLGPLVLSLGRIARKKGLDVLIESFADVVRRVPDARLAIVGPDDESLQPELQALAVRLGIGNRTTFVGMLTGREKREALAAADAWALPTRQDAWASAVTEALASGLPVVISEHANNAPDVRESGAGIVVPLGRAELANALTGLLLDAGLRRKLGERGRLFARRLDRGEVARAAIEMYQHVLAPVQVPQMSTAVAHA